MKFIIKSILLCALSMPMAGHADDKMGIGIILGEPTGVSFHAWLPGAHALSAAAGWRTSHNDEFHIQADYLVYQMQQIKIETGYLPFYFGVGARLLDTDDDTHIGVRIPFGLDYFFKDQPLDAFLELAPVLDIAPDTDFDLHGGIGLRYRF